MKSNIIRHAAAAIALAAVATACSKSPTSPGSGGGGNGGGSTATVTSLAVTGTSSIAANGTTQLTATANYSDGSQRNVTATATWTSANAAVASVSSSGLVTARGTGTAQIVAVFEGQSAQRGVTVQAPNFRITISNVTLTALGTCDDFIQGSGTGEFGARMRVERSGLSTTTLFENESYPGNANNLRTYQLQASASLNMGVSSAFTVAGAAGNSVRVVFNATEWDERIVIIPPSVTWVHDSDMNNRSDAITHSFNGTNFSGLGARTISLGSGSCRIHLDYVIASDRQ